MSTLTKIALIKEMVDTAESSLRSAKQLLNEIVGNESKTNFSSIATDLPSPQSTEDGSKIIEGVFDGEMMVDSGGNRYPVPANYASKSKLVAGDILKLTIQRDGRMLYKQIGPVERKTILGTLIYENGKYKVLANGRLFHVLLASVTYYKGEPGDKVTLLVPTTTDTDWGTIEAVLPQGLESNIDSLAQVAADVKAADDSVANINEETYKVITEEEKPKRKTKPKEPSAE